MKVTVYDIAKKSGVSQSTVSKVLNNYSQVKESTRAKVMQAIKELEFTPDLVARSMATNKTQTIGLVVGDIANPFYSETAKVIISEARERGYDVIISDTDHETFNLENLIKKLLARRVDGILIASLLERNDIIATKIYNSGFPIMLYNRQTEDDHNHYVVLNNEKGSRLAVNYLVSLGHKRISFLSGSTKYSTFNERYQGYINALKDNGIAFDESLVYTGDLSYDKIFEYTRDTLATENKPTCFFAASDSLAINVMDALTRMNFHIPKDISVIGFDNIQIASSKLINLTTISQNKFEKAKLALEKLLLLINKEHPIDQPIQITLEPELIIRQSTGPVTQI